MKTVGEKFNKIFKAAGIGTKPLTPGMGVLNNSPKTIVDQGGFNNPKPALGPNKSTTTKVKDTNYDNVVKASK
jgi:hypothetical protein